MAIEARPKEQLDIRALGVIIATAVEGPKLSSKSFGSRSIRSQSDWIPSQIAFPDHRFANGPEPNGTPYKRSKTTGDFQINARRPLGVEC